MRSARHRVIWLAAVFLALALGVVVGARLLSGPIVSGLRLDNADLQARIDAAADENKVLAERLAAADQFDARMAGRIVGKSLAGRSVVLFRTPDAQDGDVAAAARLLGQAGAGVTGTIALTEEFVQANAAEKLRSVVNSPIVPAGRALNAGLADPSAQAGDLLGMTLLINRDAKTAPVDDAARETVLAALRDTGFITYARSTEGARTEDSRPGAANAAVVVIGGALPDNAGNQGVTVARFAAGLVPHGSAVVLAGRDGSASGVAAVAVARGDAQIGNAVTTVDDIGAEAGRITTVLALQSMITGAPAGKYGIGAGADAVTVR